jgi:membrane associated rhomboid family serine protease
MTKGAGRLIAANIAVFILMLSQDQSFSQFAFVPALVVQRPWTLVTYMFLHGGFGHIFFNMLSLFYFGPRVEARIGSRNFLYLYFLSGLGGSIFSLLLAPHAAVVGASGAVFGILLAFARFWPHERIYLWFVLPVKARWLVAGLAFLSIYSGFGGGGSTIAHFAHLGGFAGGWAFLAWHRRRAKSWQRGPVTATSTIQRLATQMRQDTERWKTIPLDQLHPINREEVERVLQKLEVSGLGSLTPDERAFLDRMS